MSRSLHRARPQTDEPVTSAAMARTASKSPTDAMGNPASMTSTPSAASARAISSFSAMFMLAPGDCSPSRKRGIKDPDPVRLGRRCRCGRILGLGRAHDSALSSVLRGSSRFTDACRTQIGPRAARWKPEARKTRSPEIHRAGGSRGFVGLIPVRSRRTLRCPPRPADKAEA